MRSLRSTPLAFAALVGASLFAACDQPDLTDPSADLESAQSALSAGTYQLGSGILWHLPNNEVHVWDMANGTSPKDLYIGSADRNVWTPVATGDFNKDGTGDIIWRSQGLSLSDWFLTDTRLTANTAETYNVPFDPFHNANVGRTPRAGDVNGDGIADLVWNGLTGVPTLTWYMNNGTTTPASTSTSSSSDKVLVVGDLDNDAGKKADVLRRRNSDGMVTIEYNQSAAVNMEVVGFEWNLVGSGDFNNDQTVDVLWHNSTTGLVHIWYMKPGAKAVTVNRVNVSTVDYYSGWSVTGVGDFNHDNISDILWSHTSGVVSVWTMAANGSPTFGATIAIPSGAWFAGIIELGAPTAPTNITALPQSISSGNGQVIAPVRFNVPAQRVTDQVEIWEAVGSTPVFRQRLAPTLMVAPNTMQVSLSPSNFAGGANACIYLKAWEQGRVSALSPKVCLVSLPPPMASNDYTMPARFGMDLNNDTAIDLMPGSDAIKALRTDLWDVEFNGCASNDFNAGGRINKWTWSEGGAVLVPEQDSCIGRKQLAQGTHQITLSVKTTDGRVGSGTFAVTVKNTNIVVMGDSLVSGEANPLKLFQSPSFWGSSVDAQCHRSASAFSARAALALERSDPRSSVTYLSVACTGAIIENIVGDLDHRGQRPQLKQVRKVLCDSEDCTPPRIDAVVFDGGVNDLGRAIGPNKGFGDLISFCVTRDLVGTVNGVVAPHCGDDPEVITRMNIQLNTVGERLKTVASQVKALAPTAKIFTGDYPDPTSYQPGVMCSGFVFKDLRQTGFVGLNGEMSASDVRWLSAVNTAFTSRLKNVYERDNGFKFVNYTPVFVGHGLCATDHWMQQYHESFSHQADEMGTLHPNDYGHAAMAQALVAKMVQEGVASSTAPTHVPMQTFVFPALATTRYDWGTTCTPTGSISQPMHCCPAGWAMTGLQADGNLLKCKKIVSPANEPPMLDTGTQRMSMHTCPLGSVMVGFHGHSNRFACQRVNSTISETADSGGVQDPESAYVFHVCGPNLAMTGVHIGQNRFGCGTGAVSN